MLNKLMKYDLKSMFKVFVPLWLALLAVSLVNRFTVNSSSMPRNLAMLLYVGLMIAVIVVSVVLVILRFYTGLLKDEGYLMFTLPVRPWQLILSKCLSATIVSLLSVFVGIVSVGIISFDVHFFQNLGSFLAEVRQAITGEWVLFGVLLFVLSISGLLVAITQTYASLTLGHLANSHRVGWSVVAFIGINFLMSVIAGLGTSLTDLHIVIDVSLGSGVAELNLLLALTTGVCLLQCALFFFVTERILSKKLNLE